MQANFSRAALSYDAAAILAQETQDRMLERLDFVKINPRTLADIGCATGSGILSLHQRYPSAQALAIDFAQPMLALAQKRGRHIFPVLADAGHLPLASATLDLIWSNLMLHWLADPLPVLREWARTLAPGGLLIFCLLGPDTLRDLRVAGATQLRQFYDMHDIGDMLVEAGLSEPVMDRDAITIAYHTPRGLLRDQRQLGTRDALLGKMNFRHARQVFRSWQRMPEGYPAHFEICFGLAWKSEAKAAESNAVPTVQPVRFVKRLT